MPNEKPGRRQEDLSGVEDALKDKGVSIAETIAKAMRALDIMADKALAMAETRKGVQEWSKEDAQVIAFAKKVADTCGLTLARNPSLGKRGAKKVPRQNTYGDGRTNLTDEPTTTPGGMRRAPRPPTEEDE